MTVSPKLFSQDTSVLKRFDEKMIHIYKNGYLKNSTYFEFSRLDNEMKTAMPSFNYFELYKNYEERQTVFALLSLAGTGLMAVSVYGYEYNGNNTLFWTSSIATITCLGLAVSFESKARKNLHLAIKTRNREILAGY